MNLVPCVGYKGNRQLNLIPHEVTAYEKEKT